MTTAGIATFKFKNTEFKIRITYGNALSVYKEKFGINLLSLFEEDNLNNFISTIHLNDEKMLEIWWYYVSEKFTDYDEALQELTPDSMAEFKGALWAAVINFFDPVRRKMLLSIREKVSQLMLNQVNQMFKQLNDSLEAGSSNTSESVESIPEV